MHVLVSAGSRYGATQALAEVIAAELERRGHTVTCAEPSRVGSLAPFGAFVVGSAVYVGRWLGASRALGARIARERGDRPVWMFSSGAVGALRPRAGVDATGAAALAVQLHAVEHEVLGGRLVLEDLDVGQRSIFTALGLPTGDFRDPGQATRFGARIAGALDAGEPALR